MNATAIACVLREVFGEPFDSLTPDERREFIIDVEGLDTELHPDDEPDFYATAREMRRRLGGPWNLKSYCACLMAKHTRGKGNYR